MSNPYPDKWRSKWLDWQPISLPDAVEEARLRLEREEQEEFNWLYEEFLSKEGLR